MHFLYSLPNLSLIVSAQHAIDDATARQQLGSHCVRIGIEGQEALLPAKDALLAHQGAAQQLLVDRILEELEYAAQLALRMLDQIIVEYNLDAAREIARPAKIHELPTFELVAHKLLPIC